MTTRRTTLLVFMFSVALTALTIRKGFADAPSDQYVVAGGTVYDTKTNLLWQQNGTTTNSTWTAAQQACAELDLKGKGWRLPSIKELATIVDETRKFPSIDSAAFPNTLPDGYWSSTPLVNNTTVGWKIAFGYGNTFNVTSEMALARCVRSP